MRVNVYRTELWDDRQPVLVKECGHNYSKLESVTNPEDVTRFFNDLFHADRLAEEHVWLLGFDTKLKPLGVFEISHGSVASSCCTPREVFVRLLLCGATGFIVAHNHPSGDVIPSKEDGLTTFRLEKAGEIINIPLIDHIIIGNNRFYSFKEMNR